MKIGIIGAGNMGMAILKGIVKDNKVSKKNIFVYTLNKVKLENLKENFKINICNNSLELSKLVDCVILAVKPSVIPLVLKEIKDILLERKITIVSIAAGLTIENIEKLLNLEALPIVRVMPNINATIGLSTSAYYSNKYVSEKTLSEIKDIFESIGSLFYIDESKFSIFSAISGCSPAYVYLFIDSIAKSAQKLGFNKEYALEIICDVVKNSAIMLNKSKEHPWELIDKVCSPGGITIEGICTLEEYGFQSSIVKAVENSIKKDKTLIKKNN